MRLLGSFKWAFFWVLLAMIFNAGVYYFMGQQRALEFLGGYLIELSLSIDNLFVFITIFTSFRIKEHAQHRVLGYGIAGAIILRFVFIFFGIKLVTSFDWVLNVFGGLLIWNALKMLKEEDHQDPHDSLVIRSVSRILPMTRNFVGEKFMSRSEGRLKFTTLFAVLCLVECSDIVFAMDSVPAVFSVSTDLFVVYCSNIFAILGLRQFYFVLEHLHQRFAYVKYGVAVILGFTGVKLVGISLGWHVSIPASITIILSVLMISIMASMIFAGQRVR